MAIEEAAYVHDGARRAITTVGVDKRWSARQRDSRCNGAVLYVARATRSGATGSAAPCWRCLQWCRWAGIRRVFHWSGEHGQFERVRVSDAEERRYMTNADERLSAGLVRAPSLLLCSITDVLLYRAGKSCVG
jgi:hypothetical protein